MFDKHIIPYIKKPLTVGANLLIKRNISANQVTVVGFLIGLLALPALWSQHYTLALLLIIINRIADGLDGAIARQSKITEAGGFLDISLDFMFYALMPLGFILAEPHQNAIAGAILLVSFVGTGSSFLAFASVAAKLGIDNPIYPNKSLYYIAGITEGSETIALFIICCLWPQHFAIFAYIFASLCFITTANRIWSGFHTLNLHAQSRNKGSE
ncbi:CDP-alcohol phosphatidyltransferase family protein [Vibrio sp. S11_S32]|uniref:CDP-alcohol phosphatidyltransferase family protein n=1 Tax=Vibrio sp. S11_S32 TaxID=2720225 RepID=UPI0016810CA8|nr:CDP-alcohol phosphatidyltransferase family protein [Vibrio sp. S11_S32]MBD1576724.1 CDP-alcohol phosphatidyltransferase family protein [Vibrio sp. S11_S32]